MALTFEPHPLRALGIDTPPLITRHDQKMELLDLSGIDVVICLPFDKAFAAITARDFIEKILVDRIGMKSLIIGPDYTFGKDRTGNIDMLKEQGERLGSKPLWRTGSRIRPAGPTGFPVPGSGRSS